MPTDKILIEKFQNEFKAKPEVISNAPGRVNLIGEHTDYNGGFVLPMAIEKRIWVAGRKRPDTKINLVSLNDMPRLETTMDNIRKNGDWGDYPLGVYNELMKSNDTLTGIDAVVYGNVPLGSGLSSSAALLVSSLYFYMGLFALEIDPIERALLTWRAETDFVGLECGIMDQYISVLGQDDHALFIDCRSLESEIIPLHLGEYVIAIIDTNKPRDLVESKYNERSRECKEGVRILQSSGETDISELRDVTLEMLSKYKHKMQDNIFRRCRHVISENNRTLKSVDCLKQGNLRRFGMLMNDSHDSLRTDYEVSCDELDLIVDTARSFKYVIGARLTGAGFGGCAIALVKSTDLNDLERKVTEKYQQKFGYKPIMFVSKAVNGADFNII
jgi:galactokinase